MAEETAATVEWGSSAVEERAERARRWSPRFRLNAPRNSVALACVAAGFALALAAQLLPWATVQALVVSDNSPIGANSTAQDVGLEAFGNSGLVYQLIWPVLLALTGAAFVVGRRRRRIVCAAGIGAAGGVLMALVGILRMISNGAGATTFGNRFVVTEQAPPTTLGAGVYSAFVAVLLVVLALAFTGILPARRARAADDVVEEPETDAPPDLTVTPLEPHRPADDWSRPGDIDVRPHGAGG
jgi:hypothetical protein